MIINFQVRRRKKLSYYHLKNLDINKKNETITGEFADSNTYPVTYFKSEISGNTFHEKYSYLIYNIITGNYQPSRSSKYYILCNSWCEPALKNFSNDCNILGVEKTYDKYKNVIEDILKKKKPQILKSEIELHYKIDYVENKSYEELKDKIDSLCNLMEGIKNNPNLTYTDKLELYQKFIEINNISFPLVILTGYDNHTKTYLLPNVEKNGYLSYKITVEDIETGKLKQFKNKHMGIGWITSYGESEMAFKMQSYENRFILLQKAYQYLNANRQCNTLKKLTCNIEQLGVKDTEIRSFIDILKEDSNIPAFDYNSETKEFIFKFEPNKENDEMDIIDEMYG